MTLDCIQQPHPHLQANLEHGILTLAINRADAKNALYGELYLCIANAFDQADASNTMPAPPVKPAQNQHKPAKAQAARQVTEP